MLSAFDDYRAHAKCRSDAGADRRSDRAAGYRADRNTRSGGGPDFDCVFLIRMFADSSSLVIDFFTLSPLTGKTSVKMALKLLQRASVKLSGRTTGASQNAV